MPQQIGWSQEAKLLYRVSQTLVTLTKVTAASSSTGGGTALTTTVNTANFNNNLSAADTDVQKALDTLDNLVIGGGGIEFNEYFCYLDNSNTTDYFAIKRVSLNFNELDSSIGADLSTLILSDFRNNKPCFFIDKTKIIKELKFKSHNNFLSNLEIAIVVATISSSGLDSYEVIFNESIDTTSDPGYSQIITFNNTFFTNLNLVENNLIYIFARASTISDFTFNIKINYE